LLFEWSTNVRPSSEQQSDAAVMIIVIEMIVYMDKHDHESRGTKVNALIEYHVFSLLAIENGSYSFHGNTTFMLPRKSLLTINDESINAALESGETLSRLNL
jgi:hypothetical protein